MKCSVSTNPLGFIYGGFAAITAVSTLMFFFGSGIVADVGQLFLNMITFSVVIAVAAVISAGIVVPSFLAGMVCINHLIFGERLSEREKWLNVCYSIGVSFAAVGLIMLALGGDTVVSPLSLNELLPWSFLTNRETGFHEPLLVKEVGLFPLGLFAVGVAVSLLVGTLFHFVERKEKG